MTTDVDIEDDDRNYFSLHPQFPLSKNFCEVCDESEDVRLLYQDCMCHHFNRICIQDNKKIRHTFAVSDLMMRQIFTQEMDLRDKSGLEKDNMGIYHFQMKRMHYKQVVKHIRTLLRGL